MAAAQALPEDQLLNNVPTDIFFYEQSLHVSRTFQLLGAFAENPVFNIALLFIPLLVALLLYQFRNSVFFNRLNDV